MSELLSAVLKLVALFHAKGLLPFPLAALIKDALFSDNGQAVELLHICSRNDLDTLSEARNLETLMALYDQMEAFALTQARCRLGAFFTDNSLLDAHQRASHGSSELLLLSAGDGQAGSDASSLIYGEIEFASFSEILGIAMTGLQRKAKFVDLGSGIAKAVLWIALVTRFERIVGIEINERLWRRSQEILDEFHSTLYSSLFLTPHKWQSRAHIMLLLGSILHLDSTHDWTDADLVFANSTAFSAGLMERITTLSLRMRPGSRFITLAHHLEHPLWKVVYRDRQVMSWGLTTVWIHERTEF